MRKLDGLSTNMFQIAYTASKHISHLQCMNSELFKFHGARSSIPDLNENSSPIAKRQTAGRNSKNLKIQKVYNFKRISHFTCQRTQSDLKDEK